jgi:hypothetical protein
MSFVRDCLLSRQFSCSLFFIDMVGDGERGVILEMLLTKLVFCGAHIQVIGMSATTVRALLIIF